MSTTGGLSSYINNSTISPMQHTQFIDDDEVGDGNDDVEMMTKQSDASSTHALDRDETTISQPTRTAKVKAATYFGNKKVHESLGNFTSF